MIVQLFLAMMYIPVALVSTGFSKFLWLPSHQLWLSEGDNRVIVILYKQWNTRLTLGYKLHNAPNAVLIILHFFDTNSFIQGHHTLPLIA